MLTGLVLTSLVPTGLALTGLALTGLVLTGLVLTARWVLVRLTASALAASAVTFGECRTGNRPKIRRQLPQRRRENYILQQGESSPPPFAIRCYWQRLRLRKL
jgi:hypothetical protein